MVRGTRNAGACPHNPARTERQGVLVLLLTCSLIVSLITALAWFEHPYTFDVDTRFYIDIAEGRISSVIAPFSNRLLHPSLVAIFGYVFHLSTDASFLIVGLISLGIFVFAVLYISSSYISVVAILALLLNPFLLELFKNYYLPDLFHATLLILFFLFLYLRRLIIATVFLFLLFIARESTLLLAIVLVILGLTKHEFKIVIYSSLAMALGIAISKYFSRFGLPNVHNINELAYLILKLPFNFSRNILGISLWTDTHAANNPTAFANAPIWLVKIPGWLPSGSIQFIGIYDIAPMNTLYTLVTLLSVFGVLPSVIIKSLLDPGIRNQLVNAPFFVLVALLYGLLAFVIGPSIGTSLNRLITYGWPCFLIAIPFILSKYYVTSRWSLIRFFSASVLASWLPFLGSRQAAVMIVCVLFVLHGLALREMSHWPRRCSVPSRGVASLA